MRTQVLQCCGHKTHFIHLISLWFLTWVGLLSVDFLYMGGKQEDGHWMVTFHLTSPLQHREVPEVQNSRWKAHPEPWRVCVRGGRTDSILCVICADLLVDICRTVWHFRSITPYPQWWSQADSNTNNYGSLSPILSRTSELLCCGVCLWSNLVSLLGSFAAQIAMYVIMACHTPLGLLHGIWLMDISKIWKFWNLDHI